MNVSLACPGCGKADAYLTDMFSAPNFAGNKGTLYSTGFVDPTDDPKCGCKWTTRRIAQLHKLAIIAAKKRVVTP